MNYNTVETDKKPENKNIDINDLENICSTLDNPKGQSESKPQPQHSDVSSNNMKRFLEIVLGLFLLAWAISMTVLYIKDSSSSLDTASAESSDTFGCLRSDVPPLVDEPAILLSTAQNALVYDYWTENYFNSILPPIGPQQAVAYPPRSDGTQELKGLVAEMLSDTFATTLDPVHLYGVAGVTAALDSLFRILQNTSGYNNDAITATPYWPGFRWTSEQLKVNGTLIPFAPADQTTHQITVEDIIATLNENPSVRFVVICNPNNPLGVLYNHEHLEAIYSYILNERPDVHIISDEMYAHSILPEHKSNFVSALALEAYKSASAEQKEHVHLVWGFAKDFGLNGFKVGWIYSTNSEVQDAFEPAEKTKEPLSFVATPISSLTSYYLTGLMQAKAPGSSDVPLYKTGMVHYAEKLSTSHEMTKNKLDTLGIDYFDQNYAAQFFWLNLTHAAELAGSEETLTALLANAGVALAPGASYSADTPGYYRLCYTCYEPNLVLQGLDIMGGVLETLKTSDGRRRLMDGMNVTSTLSQTFSGFVP